MQETIQLILTYVRMVWRFRWVALVCAGLVSVAGWLFVLSLPDVYEVKTRVYLDTRSLLRPVLRGLALDTDVQSSTAQLMRRTLLVRPNLEAVARKTDMDLKAKTPEDFEKLLNNLAEKISVRGTPKSNIFVIAYQNSDPKLATRVVEAILNLFVERSLGESRKDTSKTKQFLERQIAEYEARLDAAEERLKQFKQRNLGLMPSQGKDYYDRLQEMLGARAATKEQLAEARSRLAVLRAQLEGEEPIIGLNPTPDLVEESRATPFDARIAEIESRLDGLLLKYTEKHPDVVAAKRLAEELKSERERYLAELAEETAADQAADGEGFGGGSAIENPVYQELRVAYGQAEADAAVLEQRLAQYDAKIEELQSRVDTVIRVEAELKRLNRDYAINKRNYEELLKRREALKLGEEATQTTDEVQFNILEPPREPLIPVGPNRPLLSAVVFVLGLGSGVAVALLLGMLRPGIYSRESLRELTELPVLGTVSRIWTRRERLRRRLEVATFAAGTMVLGGMFVGLLSLYGSDVDLPAKVRALTQGRLQAIAERVL